MVGFDIPFAFVFAGLLSWRAGGERLDAALLSAGIGITMPGLAFLEAYPDWDWQYLLDPAALPQGVSAFFAGAVLLSAWAGHRVGAREPRAIIAVAGLLGLYLLVSLPRILHVGDRAAYLAGEAPLLPVPFLLFCAAWMSLSGVVLGLGLWTVEKTHRARVSRGEA